MSEVEKPTITESEELFFLSQGPQCAAGQETKEVKNGITLGFRSHRILLAFLYCFHSGPLVHPVNASSILLL